jgi:hypothetical protein
MWKLGLRPRNSLKRNSEMGFSLQCVRTEKCDKDIIVLLVDGDAILLHRYWICVLYISHTPLFLYVY